MEGIEQQVAKQTTPQRNSPGGIVFWLLLAMAVGTFAPCVLLPEWRQVQALRLAEQAQQNRVEQIEQLVEKDRRLLDAMRRDPAVVTRLAQRELGFQRPGEKRIAVAGTASDKAYGKSWAASAMQPQPAPPRLVSSWPDFEFDRVFCGPRTRPILMAMSIALAATAFGLYGWRHRCEGKSSGEPAASDPSIA